MLADLHSASSENNTEKVHRVAHSLKGLLGNDHAQRAFALIRELGSLARAGDVAAALKLLSELKEELIHLSSSLNDFRDTLGGT